MKHSFAIEMKSKKYVKTISISNEEHNRVLFEGYLGDLKKLAHIEGRMLEINCSNGVLRLDLNERELRNLNKNSS